jgi:uncharacterized protein (DUF488 family)
MSLTKILITVKTYPAISSKYEELVCTAGFLEDGTWIRIYPIQFRKKSYSEQYKKYDWVELDLVKNNSDFRPESYRLYSFDSEIKIVDHIGTENNWAERKSLVLQKVHLNLSKLIAEAHNKEICTSLAVFKPKRILDLLKKHQRIALTCFEANICQCHRKHLAEAIANLPEFDYELKHI